MERPPRHGDLEIPADEQHDRREARIEHIGWVVWLVVLVAAVLGLLGPGPLSHQEVRDPEGRLVIVHHRLVRHEAAAEIDLHVAAKPGPDRLVRVWIHRSLGQSGAIHGIDPPPVRSETVGDRVVHAFQVNGEEPLGHVRIRWQPSGMGSVHLQAGVGDGPGVPFRAFVLP